MTRPLAQDCSSASTARATQPGRHRLSHEPQRKRFPDLQCEAVAPLCLRLSTKPLEEARSRFVYRERRRVQADPVAPVRAALAPEVPRTRCARNGGLGPFSGRRIKQDETLTDRRDQEATVRTLQRAERELDGQRAVDSRHCAGGYLDHVHAPQSRGRWADPLNVVEAAARGWRKDPRAAGPQPAGAKAHGGCAGVRPVRRTTRAPALRHRTIAGSGAALAAESTSRFRQGNRQRGGTRRIAQCSASALVAVRWHVAAERIVTHAFHGVAAVSRALPEKRMFQPSSYPQSPLSDRF